MKTFCQRSHMTTYVRTWLFLRLNEHFETVRHHSNVWQYQGYMGKKSIRTLHPSPISHSLHLP